MPWDQVGIGVWIGSSKVLYLLWSSNNIQQQQLSTAAAIQQIHSAKYINIVHYHAKIFWELSFWSLSFSIHWTITD